MASPVRAVRAARLRIHVTASPTAPTGCTALQRLAPAACAVKTAGAMIHRQRNTGVAAVLGLSAGLVSGLPTHAHPSVERRIRSAISDLPHADAAVGACVLDLATGSTLLEERADAPFIPASNMKVFTMAAAIAILGPGFAFETSLATNGSDILVIGDGDPALGDERLSRRRGETITTVFERWADALIDKDMHDIAGDIVIDESIFDGERVHQSWEKGDLGHWYAAPVGGLNFNGNCLDITVRPAATPGDLVHVSVQPEGSLARIINECRSGGKKNPILHHPHDTFEYTITGECNKVWPFAPVTYADPGQLAANSLRKVLLDKGVTVQGGIRREMIRLADGSLPPSLTIVARHRTALADVLSRTGKDSQNLFAECLLKRVGYEWVRDLGRRDVQGSWALGSRAVAYALTRAGIDTAGMVVADGSGLSRLNRCTARQLTATLAWMNTSSASGLFHDSLSIAGVDGSLRTRLRNTGGRIFGKTGTMRGVRSLSGYVDGSKRRYAFAVIFNGYTGSSAPYKEIQDRICRALLDEASREAVAP
ncbi:MAG: D-alanyl-D-alanine carboxypeptidase/D-alanyl-D-alanine-endopeptidase [Phycisphaerae bacterium]